MYVLLTLVMHFDFLTLLLVWTWLRPKIGFSPNLYFGELTIQNVKLVEKMPSQLPWGCWETTSTFSLQVRNAWMAFLSVHVSGKEHVWEYFLNIIPEHHNNFLSQGKLKKLVWKSWNPQRASRITEKPLRSLSFARGLKTISPFRLPDSRLTPFLQCSTKAQKSSFSNFSGKSFSSQHPPIPAIRLRDSSFRKRPTTAFESIKHQIRHHKIPRRRKERLSGQVHFCILLCRGPWHVFNIRINSKIRTRQLAPHCLGAMGKCCSHQSAAATLADEWKHDRGSTSSGQWVKKTCAFWFPLKSTLIVWVFESCFWSMAMCLPWLSALGSGVYGRLVYLRPGSTVNTQHLVDSKRRFAFVADGQSWAEAIGLSATDPCLHVRLGTFLCNKSTHHDFPRRMGISTSLGEEW